MTDPIKPADTPLPDRHFLEFREKRILEKMESLEFIAAGVAHDMNNILSGIVTYPEVLLMRKGIDDNTRKALKIILDSGERAAALIADLTTIARDNSFHRESVDLSSMVKEYLISPEYRKIQVAHAGIVLKTSLYRHCTIDASRLHIRRSIMHLVSYAAQSMGEYGQIHISTAPRTLDADAASAYGIAEGEYAVLSVSFAGAISEENKHRIFEPFYTRKILGRHGTGLEFPVVWHTAKDHQGCATVTGDDANTRFDLFFPLALRADENQGG